MVLAILDEDGGPDLMSAPPVHYPPELVAYVRGETTTVELEDFSTISPLWAAAVQMIGVPGQRAPNVTAALDTLQYCTLYDERNPPAWAIDVGDCWFLLGALDQLGEVPHSGWGAEALLPLHVRASKKVYAKEGLVSRRELLGGRGRLSGVTSSGGKAVGAGVRGDHSFAGVAQIFGSRLSSTGSAVFSTRPGYGKFWNRLLDSAVVAEARKKGNVDNVEDVAGGAAVRAR